MKRKREPAAGDTGAPAEGTETFEGMMERLESLVERLEDGNLSLEDSIRSFEEGMALVTKCGAVLDGAEKRIERLTQDAAGSPKTEDLDDSEIEDEGNGDPELPF